MKDENEFPMYGTETNMYADLEDGPAKKEIKISIIERIKCFFGKHIWLISCREFASPLRGKYNQSHYCKCCNKYRVVTLNTKRR